MKKALLALVMMAVSAGALDARSVRVKGYVRKDGTYVAPHYRSAPNRSTFDNWSTRGNVNPYTGKQGTTAPYGSNPPAISPPSGALNAWDAIGWPRPKAPEYTSAPFVAAVASELPASFHGTFASDISQCKDPDFIEKVVVSAKTLGWYETTAHVQTVTPEPSPPNAYKVQTISSGEGQMWETNQLIRLSPDGEFILIGEFDAQTGARPLSKDLVIMRRCAA